MADTLAPSASSMPATAPPAPTVISANTGSRLASLPEELVSNIAVKLGSDDLCAFRLTCRDVEAKSLHEFATEYFQSKCFMFTTESLKVLLGIARSEKLRRYLKHVYFITILLPRRPLMCKSGCRHWSPTIRQEEAYTLYIKDHENLLATKGDRRFLSDAFKTLEELQTLCLVDDPTSLPPGVECRGLNKFRRTTSIRPSFAAEGEVPDPGAEYCSSQHHVWRTMLLAVAESGVSSITRLLTRFRVDHQYALSPIADLTFKSSTMSRLQAAFSKLIELKLAFRTHLLRPGKNDRQDDTSRAAKVIKSFMPAISAVTSVSFMFDGGDLSGAICKSLTNRLDLGKLTKLSLDTLWIDMRSLISIVCKLEAATCLTLHGIELTEANDSWVPILEAVKRLPKLQHLHLIYLQVSGQRVYFLEQPDPDDTNPPWDNDLVDQMAGDAGDWMDDEGDGSDGEPPELIAQEEMQDELGANSEEAGVSEEAEESEEEEEEEEEEDPVPSPPAPEPTRPVNKCKFYTGKDFKAPGASYEKMPERGYYICLSGADEIQKHLAVFMKECNTGGAADPMDYNNLLNTILGGAGGVGPVGGVAGGVVTLQVPPPFGAPPPMPPNAGAQAQGQAAAGSGGPVGPPPPPGYLATALQNIFGGFGVAVPPGGIAQAQFAFPAAPAQPAQPAPLAPAQPPAGNQTTGASPNGAAASAQAVSGAANYQQGESDHWMFEDHEKEVDHGELDDVD